MGSDRLTYKGWMFWMNMFVVADPEFFYMRGADPNGQLGSGNKPKIFYVGFKGGGIIFK